MSGRDVLWADQRTRNGDDFLFGDRHHFVLKAIAGSWLRSGDEGIAIRQGELWRFNNKAAHKAWNPGAEDRIQLVFDTLNADGKRMLDHTTRVHQTRVGDAATPGNLAARSLSPASSQSSGPDTRMPHVRIRSNISCRFSESPLSTGLK